jgi:hypothetical protein
MIGTGEGELHFYDSINFNLSGLFNQVSGNFLGLKSIVGSYSAVAIADLDSDDNLDLILGQDLGGLFRLEHDATSNLNVSEHENDLEINIYPNPNNGIFTIKSSHYPIKLEIISLDGKLLFPISIFSNSTDVDIKNLSSGVYFLKYENSNKAYRVIKN